MIKNRKRGFTVVELVIVIAVIGILSAILIPTFVGLTAKANEAALQENLRNAYVVYATENGETEAADMTKVVLSKDVVTKVALGEDKEDVTNLYQVNKLSAKWEGPKTLSGNFKPVGQVDNEGNYADYNGYYVYVFVEAE